MPTDNGVGWGGATPAKHQQFRQIAVTHLRVVDAILHKWGNAYQTYLYLDLNAGPGKDDAGIGSPLAFVQEAERLAVPYHAWLFEQVEASADALSGELAGVLDRYGVRDVIRGDHAETADDVANDLSRIVAPAYGLVYADPTGTALPIDVIRSLVTAPHRSKLDVLVYVSATNYNRRRGAGCDDRFLMDDMKAIGKRVILLREPMLQHRWTFALLSDWPDIPKFRQIGFHQIGTPSGDALAQLLNWSVKEANGGGPPFDHRSTEATPSTSELPNFWPSERRSSDGRVAAASGVDLPVQQKLIT